jgi:hypothetical protein
MRAAGQWNEAWNPFVMLELTRALGKDKMRFIFFGR